MSLVDNPRTVLVRIPRPGPERDALCRKIGKAVFPRDYESASYVTVWGEKRGMAQADAIIEQVLSKLEKEA